MNTAICVLKILFWEPYLAVLGEDCVYVALGFEFSTLHLLSTCFTTWASLLDPGIPLKDAALSGCFYQVAIAREALFKGTSVKKMGWPIEKLKRGHNGFSRMTSEKCLEVSMQIEGAWSENRYLRHWVIFVTAWGGRNRRWCREGSFELSHFDVLLISPIGLGRTACLDNCSENENQ